MEKLKLRYPVIVEGKYDKITLSNVVSSAIIVLNGFSVFKNEEKRALIKKLCENGAILLTDSDKAGSFIRAKLKGYFKDLTLYNVYVPQIEGREKRKKKDSADGLLGVEGMETSVLRDLLSKFKADDCGGNETIRYTKSDMYALGLSGKKNSGENRDRIAEKAGLPKGMTPNAFLEAVNLLGIELG